MNINWDLEPIGLAEEKGFYQKLIKRLNHFPHLSDLWILIRYPWYNNINVLSYFNNNLTKDTLKKINLTEWIR